MGWRELSARVGRNDLPYVMFTNWHRLAEWEKPTALSESWAMAEWPERAADTELWLMAFDDVGYMVDGEVLSRDEDPDLPDPVTLWRGALPERRNGLSWTLDKDRALWFADRFGRGRKHLYEITIPHEFCLARITTRNEHEVVVDTSSFEEDEYTILS